MLQFSRSSSYYIVIYKSKIWIQNISAHKELHTVYQPFPCIGDPFRTACVNLTTCAPPCDTTLQYFDLNMYEIIKPPSDEASYQSKYMSQHFMLLFWLYISYRSSIYKNATIAWMLEVCAEYALWCKFSLRWHHNGRGGISNHQPHECLLKRSFGHRSK